MPSSMNYAAAIAYDGMAFHGFIRQPNKPTVEQNLRELLEPHIGPLKRLVIAGRTDKGVSATCQIVSFKSTCNKLDPETIKHIINISAQHITCIHVEAVSHTFHAQFHCTARRYVYLHPLSEQVSNAFVQRLNLMLGELLGKHCFYAFSRDVGSKRSTVRELQYAHCRPDVLNDQPHLRFSFKANGFLRRQIRVLVATALHEAQRKPFDPMILVNIARERAQHRTQRANPAEHLYFVGADYPVWSPKCVRTT